MQIVILCAGKGTRMGALTQNTPKPLIPIGELTLLEHKLSELPQSITNVVLVIGYLGDQIIQKIGSEYSGIKIHYAKDSTLTGTAHALWQAKDLLEEKFLVMMGDDIYKQYSIEECLQHDFSIVCKKANPGDGGSRVSLNELGHPEKFISLGEYKSKYTDEGLIFTGLCSLTKEIFNHDPVQLEAKKEWGLPQTLLTRINPARIKVIETDFWLPIGTPEELEKARKILF